MSIFACTSEVSSTEWKQPNSPEKQLHINTYFLRLRLYSEDICVSYFTPTTYTPKESKETVKERNAFYFRVGNGRRDETTNLKRKPCFFVSLLRALQRYFSCPIERILRRSKLHLLLRFAR
ncbi:hypothetical protein NPIL_139081 [Nephila pilipes]|uniref:Uncharacterized protein n=1 Tax=Nephila pilipes TaxID=299642 RepID=A0A8X6PGU6_NEPPI|nr:hypothetical protein NPIL_139081 [Nephila pilipes]